MTVLQIACEVININVFLPKRNELAGTYYITIFARFFANDDTLQ